MLLPYIYGEQEFQHCKRKLQTEIADCMFVILRNGDPGTWLIRMDPHMLKISHGSDSLKRMVRILSCSFGLPAVFISAVP
jgi:hypothetical protein